MCAGNTPIILRRFWATRSRATLRRWSAKAPGATSSRWWAPAAFAAESGSPPYSHLSGDWQASLQNADVANTCSARHVQHSKLGAACMWPVQLRLEKRRSLVLHPSIPFTFSYLAARALRGAARDCGRAWDRNALQPAGHAHAPRAARGERRVRHHRQRHHQRPAQLVRPPRAHAHTPALRADMPLSR